MFVVAKKRCKEREARGYLQQGPLSKNPFCGNGRLCKEGKRKSALPLSPAAPRVGEGAALRAWRPGPLLQNQTGQSLIAKHGHKTAGVPRVFMALSPKTHPKWQSQNPHLDPSLLCRKEDICAAAMCSGLVVTNFGLEHWGGGRRTRGRVGVELFMGPPPLQAHFPT